MKAVLGTVFLLTLATLPLHEAAAQSAGSWTVLVYLDADNNLEPSGLGNMHEMESVGPAPGVRVLVQMDRAPGYDTTDGDWQGTHRYEIVKDSTGSQDALASPVKQDLGEVDMSDKGTLRDFLEWGVQTAPADHYYVILWDHGDAWDGALADETTGPNAIMSLADIHSAFSDASNATGVHSWDVVDFDACLMGNADVVHSMNGIADVVVASEELVPGQGLPYPTLLSTLDANPKISPIDIAKAVVPAFAARYSGNDPNIPQDAAAVLSAYDMTYEAAFNSAVTNFLGAIGNDANASWPVFVRDAKASERFTKPDLKNSQSLDVGDLAGRVANTTTDVALEQAIKDVKSAEGLFVVAHSTSPNHPNATGITLQFPTPTVGGTDAAQDASSSDTTTGDRAAPPHARAFNALVDAAASDKTDPTVSDFALDSPSTFTAAQPLSLHASASDPNLDSVEVAVSQSKADGETVLLYLEPSTLKLSSDETNATAAFTWDGSGTALSNGAGSALVPAYSAGPDGGFLVDGNYTTAGVPTFSATLEFAKNGSLAHVWADGGPASEVTPRVGDSFAPVFLHFDAQGNDHDLAGTPIVATKAGLPAWSLVRGAVAPGDYLVSIYADDLAGNANLTDPMDVTLEATHATTTPSTTTTPETATTPSSTPSGTTPETTSATAKGTPGVGVAALVALAAGVALVARPRRR